MGINTPGEGRRGGGMLYGYKGIYRIATGLGSMYYGPWIFCWELDVLLFLVVVGWMVLGFSRAVQYAA